MNNKILKITTATTMPNQMWLGNRDNSNKYESVGRFIKYNDSVSSKWINFGNVIKYSI